MNKGKSRFLTAMLAAACVVPAHAGDAAAGKTKAAMCAACHGPMGISIAPQYPNLAGQKELYLTNAIKAYKTGVRKDPTMTAMVASLTEDDITNLAAHFSSLKP